MSLKRTFNKKFFLFLGVLLIISLVSFTHGMGNNTSPSYDVSSLGSESLKVFQCGNTSYFYGLIEQNLSSESQSILEAMRQDYVDEGGERIFWKYLFEGEKVNRKVLVLDTNGFNRIIDVYTASGTYRNEHGYDIEDYCRYIDQDRENIDYSTCNLGEYSDNFSTFNSSIMGYFDCKFSVKDPDHMYGLKWTTVEAKNSNGYYSSLKNGEFFFFNPILQLSKSGGINIEKAFSGKTVYSDILNITNTADGGSGVDMFLDLSADNLKSIGNSSFCDNKDYFPLGSIYYYAENGKYSTLNNAEADKEGYINIAFSNSPILGNQESIHELYLSNILTFEKDIPIKFRFNIPNNCYGNFRGNIKVFGWEPLYPSQNFTLEIPINLNITSSISTTPPEATIKYNQKLKDLEISGMDYNGQAVRVKCLSKYANEICNLNDKEGNSLNITLHYTGKGTDYLTFNITNLVYNGDPIKPVRNLFTIRNYKDRLVQYLYLNSMEGSIVVSLNYDKKTNKTKIIIGSSQEPVIYMEEGFVFIELITDNGKLKYNLDKARSIRS